MPLPQSVIRGIRVMRVTHDKFLSQSVINISLFIVDFLLLFFLQMVNDRKEQISMALRIPASSIRHRIKFNLANKNVEETMENWYKRLKELAEPCKYGTYSEAFILQQFICGLDGLLVERLHAEQKDLALVDVFDLTKSYERSNDVVDVVSVCIDECFCCRFVFNECRSYRNQSC